MTSHELSVYLILSAGLLAMPIGAYGLLEALNKRRPCSEQRQPLRCVSAGAATAAWVLKLVSMVG